MSENLQSGSDESLQSTPEKLELNVIISNFLNAYQIINNLPNLPPKSAQDKVCTTSKALTVSNLNLARGWMACSELHTHA
jgi:hypothetical protein